MDSVGSGKLQWRVKGAAARLPNPKPNDFLLPAFKTDCDSTLIDPTLDAKNGGTKNYCGILYQLHMTGITNWYGIAAVTFSVS